VRGAAIFIFQETYLEVVLIVEQYFGEFLEE
jgi:hypothetical protein